ncbi:MAG: hypothetical protein COW18_12800 [Zetaproteobacteria bacterium CG12_big_fil_rev_8_21_14_0_65_54_13]|nr:MAG: hypothetical protein COW18_12800 [Zetaproteobacteria bacterium CG12_big_fil_rev_8_21_14_0_65_54_13]PIX55319.1 MAG: hypothetical protein COZ50_03375 [Zetaproteobacteria bacterium CG_4_10_14_3_um_filter_54_28]PJA27709.1 MAG: hypothetical protein CO188_11650 [Zetaproteobacteria bacterium CG_4_9_14_3_um_filter_54_145]
MLATIRENLAPRHLGLIGLCLLAWAYMALFRYDSYGIEEAAALDLLLNWSIIHQIASPVAFFGVPDFRAILFIPLDMHWVGSIPAAKVYTMLFLFGTALLLYQWGESRHSGESSMMATALLLISPISLMQTDAIGSGVYLLWAFVVSAFLDRLLHESERSAPSWFFLQILACAFAVSLHPMGLALPLALIWRWTFDQGDRKKAQKMIIAMVLTMVAILLLRWGWYGMEAAASNPLIILADAIIGSPLLHTADSWGIGLIVADLGIAAIAATLFMHRRNLDSTTLMLIFASLIGLSNADHAWVLIFWATTLYLGIPLLIRLNERLGWRGIIGQRGVVLVSVMLLATIAMITARNSINIGKLGLKSDTDMVISILSNEAEASPIDGFIAASQWPARTLLATRRDVLPLPPASEEMADFSAKIRGITHVAFNPQQEHMHGLARNFAALSDKYETIALMPGGVVLKQKSPVKSDSQANRTRHATSPLQHSAE